MSVPPSSHNFTLGEGGWLPESEEAQQCTRRLAWCSCLWVELVEDKEVRANIDGKTAQTQASFGSLTTIFTLVSICYISRERGRKPPQRT